MEVVALIVQYCFPTVALLLSILSYVDSRRVNALQRRVLEIEERLKSYELQEREKEREEATEACIEARIVNVSRGRYRLKIWNSGKAVALNADFMIPQDIDTRVTRDKVPFEFLEPGKSFEEAVLVHHGTPRKFLVTTTWLDRSGNPHSREQMVSI